MVLEVDVVDPVEVVKVVDVLNVLLRKEVDVLFDEVWL